MVKTGYFRKRKDNSSNVSASTGPDIEILSPFVMGSPDVIGNYPELQGLREKCLRFCSNPEQTCMVTCLTLHFEILSRFLSNTFLLVAENLFS